MLTFAIAKEAREDRSARTVIAVVNMMSMGGALIFQPLVGYIADLTGGDYGWALAAVPLSAAVGAVLILVLPEYRHPDHRAAAMCG